ncbi:hypothetical protein ACSSS7_001812 [Eimeria intestinalis]
MGAVCTRNRANQPRRDTTPAPLMCGMQPPDSLLSASRGSSARNSMAGNIPVPRSASIRQQQQQQQQRSSSATRVKVADGRRPSSTSLASGSASRRPSEAGSRAPSTAGSPSPAPQQQQAQQPEVRLIRQHEHKPLPPGFGVSKGQPPHHMLSGELTRISCGLMFHIRVYGMKARCLELSGNSVSTSLRLEWAAPLPADRGAAATGPAGATQQQHRSEAGAGAGGSGGEVLTLTTQSVRGRSPKWLEAFEFTWHSPSLDHLQRRALVFSVIENPGTTATIAGASAQTAATKAAPAPRVVGRGSVSLFAVATGPVHHDVLLKDAEGSSQAGRLIMDVRMQQICDLVINPIEILAHLSDSASAAESDDEDSDEEETKATTATEEQRSSGTDAKEGASTEAAAGAEASKRATESTTAATTSANLKRTASKTSDVFCRTESHHFHSFASRSHSFRCGERQRRQAAAAANRAARAAQAARATASVPVSGTSGSGQGAANNNTTEEGMPLEEEEEPGPLSAHWLLSFSPTGVDNPRDAFSVETENVQQPYWNAVDHALLGHRLKAAVNPTGSATNSPHRLTRSSCSDNLGTRSLDAPGMHADSLASLTSLPGYVNSEESSVAGDRSLPSEPVEHAEANYRRAVEYMVSPELEDAAQWQVQAEVAHGEAAAASDAQAGDESNTAPSGPPVARLATQKRHLGHLDVKSTYQKLAALAARGELVKEVLHDTFPTLRLSTTIDQLRQHYLRIRLHAKVFGSSGPSLFGECWLPFFKVYDADVVTTRPRQFFDSYFREKLWLDGKQVGTLEGVIVFQNNPVVRQVCAGVQTEKGLCRIFPPVLGHEHRPVCFKFSGAGNAVPAPVARIAGLHEKLLHLITKKTQQKAPADAPPVASAVTAILTSVRKASEPEAAGAKTLAEVKDTCDELQQLLNTSDVDSRRSFLFGSEAELLRTQRVMLNLANHTLEFMDYVFWQCRANYCAVLCAILRRGELDLGTVLPSRPDSYAALTLSEVYVLYTCIKKDNSATAAAAAASGNASSTGSSTKPKLFVSQRSIDFDSSNTNGGSSSSKAGGGAQQQQGGAGRNSITNALLPRIGGGDGETARGYFGAALHKLRNAGIAVVSAGEAEAAAQLGRDLGATKMDVPEDGGQDELAAWKAHHLAAVSEERKEELTRFARSLSMEARFTALLYHKRLKLCRQFRLLLHRVLAAALKMLGAEASFGGQRRLACMLLAMTYFRLPEFRKELLKSVLTEEGRNAVIEEWRGTEFLLDPASLQAAETWTASSPLRILLQWEVFHTVLTDYFGAATLQEDIDALQGKITFETDWRQELGLQGTSFFSFVEQWARSVLHSLPPKTNVDWRELPGYSTLLKRLLLELKARNVCKFPDSLVSCTGALLANEKLLSVFVKIVFLRTHAHRSPQVFSALTYVDFWSQLLASHGRQLPPNFDFAFLRKGLQLIIDSDLYMNVCKGLWFVYRNLPIFNGEQLEEILGNICLRRHGVRLFFHWAWIVRRNFMWILLYRLIEGMRRVIGRITGVEPSFTRGNQTFELQPGLIKMHQQQQQQDGLIVPTNSRRIALSAEESVVIRGHSMLLAFLRSLSLEDILPVSAVQIAENAEADVAATPGGAPGLSPFGVPPQKPHFEGDVNAPELQVYRVQAAAEFRREVVAYKAWVGEGASSLPTMAIPSAPLDATTDVPLEGWQ